MCGEEDRATGYKEAILLRVKRDEEDVREFVGCFILGFMINFFSLDYVINC